jgi:hypothetical protein
MFILPLLFSFIIPKNIDIKYSRLPKLNIYLDDFEHEAMIPPSGGKIKLLTHLNAESWAHNWMTHISNSEEFDDHYYLEYFIMKGMTRTYTSNNDLYLGFFPDEEIKKDGPKYIALFNLQNKTFNTKCIIENPFYIYQKSELTTFKSSVKELAKKNNIYFTFEELNVSGQYRYYLDWYYF